MTKFEKFLCAVISIALVIYFFMQISPLVSK